MGRPRLTKAELRGRGSWRAKLRDREAQAPAGEPAMPDRVRRIPTAATEWRSLCDRLADRGLLAKCDGQLIAGTALANWLAGEAAEAVATMDAAGRLDRATAAARLLMRALAVGDSHLRALGLDRPKTVAAAD